MEYNGTGGTRIEWSGMEVWNGVELNKPFIPLFGYSMMKNKFWRGTKLKLSGGMGWNPIPSYSIIIFENQTMEHWVHLFKLLKKKILF
jgi:hypothetical protein